jgi:hypothetical protein
MKVAILEGIVVLLLLTVSAAAQDQSCNEQSVKGSYGFVSSIRVVPPAHSQVKQTSRLRFIGLFTYDGSGKVTAVGITVGADGKTAPFNGTGTYKINPPLCTGIAVFQNQQGNVHGKWDFVMASGGNQLLTIIETEPNSAPFTQVKR